MRASVVMGGLAALFLVIVVLGGPALTAANASAGVGPARPWVLDALGLAWMFSLLAAFAVGCLFFIAWAAEDMAAEGPVH